MSKSKSKISSECSSSEKHKLHLSNFQTVSKRNYSIALDIEINIEKCAILFEALLSDYSLRHGDTFCTSQQVRWQRALSS